MNITPESPVTFRSGVAGVECDILVTHYLPSEPDNISGPMEDAVEGVPAEFEFTVMTNGSEDIALRDRMTRADEERLLDEFEVYLLALKHDKDF
jgi:hypothetical protein